MSSDRDIIQRLLQMVREVQPSFSEEQALQIEQQVRHEWGGEQVKIAKRGPLLCCAKKKVRAEIGIKSPQELQSEHGISRTTLYRWIGKKEKGNG